MPKIKYYRSKTYKYILFDWDGTLARTLDIWLAALKAALERRGVSFADEVIGANFTVFKERMEARDIPDVDGIIEEADAIASQQIPNVELYADVIEVLSQLQKSGKRLSLVTTSRHDQIDLLLDKYRMAYLFDFVVCADDVTHCKPDPEPIEKALALLGASEFVVNEDSPSNEAIYNIYDNYNNYHKHDYGHTTGNPNIDKSLAIMIGDASTDLEAAASAGIDSVLFYPPEHRKFCDLEKLKAFKPTHVVHDLRKLLQIL